MKNKQNNREINQVICGDYMDNPELDRRNQLRKQIRERLKQITN